MHSSRHTWLEDLLSFNEFSENVCVKLTDGNYLIAPVMLENDPKHVCESFILHLFLMHTIPLKSYHRLILNQKTHFEIVCSENNVVENEISVIFFFLLTIMKTVGIHQFTNLKHIYFMLIHFYCIVNSSMLILHVSMDCFCLLSVFWTVFCTVKAFNHVILKSFYTNTVS